MKYLIKIFSSIAIAIFLLIELTKNVSSVEVIGDETLIKDLIVNVAIIPDADVFDIRDKDRVHSVLYKGKKVNNSFKNVSFFIFYVSYQGKASVIEIENRAKDEQRQFLITPYIKEDELYISIFEYENGHLEFAHDYKLESHLNNFSELYKQRFSKFFW